MIPWIATALAFLSLLLLYRRYALGYMAYFFSSVMWAWVSAEVGSQEMFVAHLVFCVATVYFWLTCEREDG